MKKSTKWKWTAFAVLFFIAMLGTVGVVASAEATENAILEDMINVDYVNETITVKTTKDEVIYYTDSYNKDVSKWDACEVRTIEVEKEDGTTEEVTAAVFDISWVTQNKTVRIYLCGDVNKKVVNVDIAWEEDFDVEFVGTLLTTEMFIIRMSLTIIRDIQISLKIPVILFLLLKKMVEICPTLIWILFSGAKGTMVSGEIMMNWI